MRQMKHSTSLLSKLPLAIIAALLIILILNLDKGLSKIKPRNQEKPTVEKGTIYEVPSQAASNRITAELVYVIDGDTLIVFYNNEERKVRLIGVNTPESVASDEYLEKVGKENTEEGKIASEWTKNFLSGVTQVQLEFDQQLEDEYGRLLAYVYVGDKMLNEELLKAGQAELMIIKPNTKYEARLKNCLE